ncbi:MAG TPA: hypothetical protein VLJ86_06205 [Ramlibacter sp.]|nr:hypothetical protein [Ramlibacter sp.]
MNLHTSGPAMKQSGSVTSTHVLKQSESKRSESEPDRGGTPAPKPAKRTEPLPYDPNRHANFGRSVRDRTSSLPDNKSVAGGHVAKPLVDMSGPAKALIGRLSKDSSSLRDLTAQYRKQLESALSEANDPQHSDGAVLQDMWQAAQTARDGVWDLRSALAAMVAETWRKPTPAGSRAPAPDALVGSVQVTVELFVERLRVIETEFAGQDAQYEKLFYQVIKPPIEAGVDVLRSSYTLMANLVDAMEAMIEHAYTSVQLVPEVPAADRS